MQRRRKTRSVVYRAAQSISEVDLDCLTQIICGVLLFWLILSHEFIKRFK